MDDTTPSGSRWEPGPEETPDRPADETPTEDPAGRPGVGRRGTLAAAGAGLLLVGSLGGFAVGHAAGDGGATPTPVQQVGNHLGPEGGAPGTGDRRSPAGPRGDRDGDGYGPPAAPDGRQPGTDQDDSGSGTDDSSTDPDADDV